jgi:hypothetical protein
MFIQLQLDSGSFNSDYLEAIECTMYEMAYANHIPWYDEFPYIYLDASKEATKKLLERFATLGWLGNEVVDTGELVSLY